MGNQTLNNFDTRRDNELNKYSPNTGTCYNKNIKNFIPGFAKQFQDTFFYANVIQFIIVTLMYYKVGNGKYWRILFLASTSGFIASVLENATVAFICLPSQKDNNSIVIPFLIDEIFWTIQQYSVPILNLIKIKALITKKREKIMKFVILFFFLIFIFFRFYIGYERMMRGYLVDDKINTLHGFAFGVIAFSDMICTISIIYFIGKQNDQNSISSYCITRQVKRSSYTILICVDIVEFFLSIFDIFANIGLADDVIPVDVATPFQCLMSNFILILATDVLLMKYESNNLSQMSCRDSNDSNNNNNNNNNAYITEKSYQISNVNQINIDKDPKHIKAQRYFFDPSSYNSSDKNFSFIS
ncbi:hypothetical protein PIROE2DRAFT_5927 [Piromyces sp. E2]|nr:hypothetical protein PIROE2DRAFT_5927 [Piromyces sp. E2]|eukprot:OUM66822.1 hypothetical protein PIROE2DRAFT_5927 [Piromyces sp. E2]